MVTIQQLIDSTNTVKGYDTQTTFSKKKFGAIYAFNKVATPKPENSIIEISMMIKGVTDIVHLKSKDRPVAIHKVLMAIKGVKQEILSRTELISRMKLKYVELREEDKEEVIIARALDPNKKPFENRTVMQVNQDKFVVLDDKISNDAEIHVWCSCSSYYWVFQYYNIDKDVNLPRYNKPMNYKYKTKAGIQAALNRKPMRNPNKAYGMCKHLQLLLALLMDSETVSATTSGAKAINKEYHLNISRFKKVERLSPVEYKKLQTKFKHDRDIKLEERRANSGFANIASMQRKKK